MLRDFDYVGCFSRSCEKQIYKRNLKKGKKAKKREFGYEVAAVQNGPYRSGETCLDFVWAYDSFLSADVLRDDEP